MLDNDRLGTSRNLLGGENLDKSQIATAVGIGRGDEVALLKGTVHIDTIVHGLAHQSVGHGEVCIVGATGLKLIAEIALGAHFLQFTHHAIGHRTDLPRVSEVALVAACIGYLGGDDTLVAEIDIIGEHIAQSLALDSKCRDGTATLAAVVGDA